MKDKWFVVLTALLLGCYATLSQVILFREELIVLEGNELALSLLLFWWLIGISVGALLPKILRVKKYIDSMLGVLFLFIPLFLLSCVFVTRIAAWIFTLPVEEKPSPFYMLIISFVSVFPVSVWIGFTFPMLATLLSKIGNAKKDSGGEGSVSIGTVFALESLGSMVGGVLVILRLVPTFNPFQIAFFMLGLVSLVLIFQPIQGKIRHGGRVIYGALAVIISGLFVLDIPGSLESWSAKIRWNTRHPGYEAVRVLETPYQRLEVGEREGQYTVFGSGTPLFSFPNEYEQAHWAHVALSQNPNPDRVLLIGSGGLNLIEHLAEHKPDKLTCVEIDPGILQISDIEEKSEMFEDREPIAFIHSDPRRFLSALEEEYKFDVIAVNQPDPSNGLLNRFYTYEFFTLALEHLSENGVFVITATGTPNYEFGDIGAYSATLYWTLREAFPNVMVVPGTQWWFFASPSIDFISDPEQLGDQLSETGLECELFSPEFYSIYFDPQRINQLEETLQSYYALPRNSDKRPLCYLYDLVLWSKQYGYLRGLPIEDIAGSGMQLLLMGVMGGIALFLIHAAGLKLILPRNMPAGFLSLMILAVTGFSAIGAEIAILLFYQSRVGYLYQHVGIFLGIFMLGLSVGAALGNRYIRKFEKTIPMMLLYVDLGLILVLAVTPLLFKGLDSFQFSIVEVEMLLLMWIAFVAILAGVLFPFVSHLVELSNQDVTSIAGWVDMSDCFGGAVGALVLGSIFVPLIGLVYVFYLFVGMKLLTLFLFFMFVFLKRIKVMG